MSRHTADPPRRLPLKFQPMRLEEWMMANFPDGFSEWELTASEWLDLDEWLEMEYYDVFCKARKALVR